MARRPRPEPCRGRLPSARCADGTAAREALAGRAGGCLRRYRPSPLYAFRECFNPEYGLAPTARDVYGVLSLIVWSLILIVSVKYLVLILRLDNRGEGGSWRCSP